MKEKFNSLSKRKKIALIGSALLIPTIAGATAAIVITCKEKSSPETISQDELDRQKLAQIASVKSEKYYDNDDWNTFIADDFKPVDKDGKEVGNFELEITQPIVQPKMSENEPSIYKVKVKLGNVSSDFTVKIPPKTIMFRAEYVDKTKEYFTEDDIIQTFFDFQIEDQNGNIISPEVDSLNDIYIKGQYLNLSLEYHVTYTYKGEEFKAVCTVPAKLNENTRYADWFTAGVFFRNTKNKNNYDKLSQQDFILPVGFSFVDPNYLPKVSLDTNNDWDGTYTIEPGQIVWNSNPFVGVDKSLERITNNEPITIAVPYEDYETIDQWTIDGAVYTDYNSALKAAESIEQAKIQKADSIPNFPEITTVMSRNFFDRKEAISSFVDYLVKAKVFTFDGQKYHSTINDKDYIDKQELYADFIKEFPEEELATYTYENQNFDSLSHAKALASYRATIMVAESHKTAPIQS